MAGEDSIPPEDPDQLSTELSGTNADDDLDSVIDDVITAEIVGEATRRAMELEVTTRVFSGPVPDPALLAEYEQVVPGSALRLLDAALANMDHRQEMQKSDSDLRHETLALNGVAIRAQSGLGRRGQVFAFVLALIVLVGSIGLIATDRQIAGTILVTVDLVALVTVFIAGGRVRGPDERTEDDG